MDAQSLDTHKKVLGIIYVITATLMIIFAIAIRSVMWIIFEFAFDGASDEELRIKDFIMALTSFLPIVIIVFSAVPTLIAGVGLLMRQSWAPLFALIMGVLKLISVPIGTAIGIYAIWIYSEDQKLKKSVNA